jgi:hypothetical protein
MKEVNGRSYFDWEYPIKPTDLEIVRTLIQIDNIGFMEKRDPIVLLYTNDEGIEFKVCDLGQYLVKHYPRRLLGKFAGRNVISVIEVNWDRNKYSYTDFLAMLFDPENEDTGKNYIENIFHLYEL